MATRFSPRDRSARTPSAIELWLRGRWGWLAAAFVLIAGHAADRLSRKHIVLGCFALQLGCALALLALTRAGLRSPWPVFAVMVVLGSARAAMGPASQALLPNLVPQPLLGNAVAINSAMWQVATIAGPAVGGGTGFGGAGGEAVVREAGAGAGAFAGRRR